MPHKISILVRADVGRDAIELLVTGCLTEDTAGILATQLSKARDLDPSAPILLDLTDARHIESGALASLRSLAEVREVGGRLVAPLQLLTPATVPQCPLGASPLNAAQG